MLIAALAAALLAAQAPAPVADAPPPAGADAPTATAPSAATTAEESDTPSGAPKDDFGFVNWCKGALTGHMELYPQVKPELAQVERERAAAEDPKLTPAQLKLARAQRARDAVEEEKGDEAQAAAGRDYLALYDRAIAAAERSGGEDLRLSETPGAVRGPAHALDADRAAIVSPAAPRPARAVPAAPAHGPLTALRGVKVLDLCIVLAGPTAARTLGEYGADVIKIDGPPRPAVIGPGGGDPQIGAAFNIEVNRGKRSIVLDLTTQEGLDIFWMLVDEADVVVENYRHGVVDRLGVGYEDVRKRRPDIIYASLNAYGYTGPWAQRPGHEQLGQSVTGMSLRFGGDAAPQLQTVALNDFGTGLIGAYGIGLALLHRERTGQGQRVIGSLAQTACTLQSLFLQDYDGKTWDEPRGQDAKGFGPLHRMYRASDSWLMLAAPASARARLEGVPGLEAIAGCTDDVALAAALEAALAQQPAAHWVEALRAADIGATGLGAIRAMMDDPYATGRGLSLTREHHGLGLVQTTGPAPMLSGTPLRAGRPAPAPGADSADIIAELGLDARLAALIDSGAVRV